MFKHTRNSMLNAALFVQGDPDFIPPAAQRDDHDAHSLLHIEFVVFGQQFPHSSKVEHLQDAPRAFAIQSNQKRPICIAHLRSAYTVIPVKAIQVERNQRGRHTEKGAYANTSNTKS